MQHLDYGVLTRTTAQQPAQLIQCLTSVSNMAIYLQWLEMNQFCLYWLDHCGQCCKITEHSRFLEIPIFTVHTIQTGSNTIQFPKTVGMLYICTIVQRQNIK